jgi:hypothetical protein
VAIFAAAEESSKTPLTGGVSRYVTLQSSRYDYRGVAVRAFADKPLALRRRRQLGSVLAALPDDPRVRRRCPLAAVADRGRARRARTRALLALLTGITLAVRDVLRGAPPLAAEPIAAFVTYVAHARLDWDWQMPAVTLVAIVLAAALLAQAPDVRAPRRFGVLRG